MKNGEKKRGQEKMYKDTQLLRGKAQTWRKEEGGGDGFQMAEKAQERGSGEMKRKQ